LEHKLEFKNPLVTKELAAKPGSLKPLCPSLWMNPMQVWLQGLQHISSI